jgi:hypothetical protein
MRWLHYESCVSRRRRRPRGWSLRPTRYDFLMQCQDVSYAGCEGGWASLHVWSVAENVVKSTHNCKGMIFKFRD